MESKTKVQMSHAEIQHLVGRAFDGAEIVSCREMTDGWFNTAYQITMNHENRQIVLKVGPPAEAEILSYEKNLLCAEVETMRLVCEKPGIPVPHICFDDFSHNCLPYDYYFMEFIEGTPWNKIRNKLSEDQNNAIINWDGLRRKFTNLRILPSAIMPVGGNSRIGRMHSAGCASYFLPMLRVMASILS